MKVSVQDKAARLAVYVNKVTRLSGVPEQRQTTLSECEQSFSTVRQSEQTYTTVSVLDQSYTDYCVVTWTNATRLSEYLSNVNKTDFVHGPS